MTTIARAQETALAVRPMVDAYLITRVHAEFWRGKMDAWDRAELTRYEYKASPEFVERGRPARILEPARAYMMGDSDYALFSEERQHFVESLNLGLSAGHCPALSAESLQRDAETLLLRALDATIPGISESYNMELRRQAIDLTVRLVMSQPGYKPPKV